MASLSIKEAKYTISYLKDRLEKEMKVIDILNSTIGLEMEALQIRDKTTIIVEATKVVTKKACSDCGRKYL